MEDRASEPAIFTPSNEPYLGRPLLLHFDKTISATLESNARVASYTHSADLTDLQRAACQIIPHGINLALSIRELIRQGYLFSAMVLMRSLVERAGIITYLHEHPESVELWKNGWKHGERPSLKTMLEVMGGDPADPRIRQLVSLLNHVTHGDPVGSAYNLISVPGRGPSYGVSKNLTDPEHCDLICQQAMCYLIVLSCKMTACFPDAALSDQEDGS